MGDIAVVLRPTGPRPGVSPRRARRAWLVLAAWATAAGWPLAAPATDAFPTQPIRVILGTPAGSSYDLLLRTMSEHLRAELGQPIVIESRLGADQMIAARTVAAAAPDGYTLLAATRTTMVVNPLLQASPGYQESSFAPISLLGWQVTVVAVHPSLPVRTLAELAAYSRANPGKLNYGAGAPSFMLAAESLKAAIGADMLHIPYNGIAPAVNALLAGDVQVALVDVTIAASAIRAGRLRALVITGRKRSPLLPDVPTFAEIGMPTLDLPVWNALYAPAGTPEPVIARLRDAVVRTLASPEIAEKLTRAGMVPQSSSSAELRDLVALGRSEVAPMIERLKLVPR